MSTLVALSTNVGLGKALCNGDEDAGFDGKMEAKGIDVGPAALLSCTLVVRNREEISDVCESEALGDEDTAKDAAPVGLTPKSVALWLASRNAEETIALVCRRSRTVFEETDGNKDESSP